MKTTLYTAGSRGYADHGWLKSHHSFSFGNYHDAKRMGFGTLRVLNDDEVSAGMGFGTHGHSNMEIISIPLEGDLEHKDSLGNTTIIRSGDIQVMSAGTGVKHSEYNHSKENRVKFLQIWVIPNKVNVSPRYDQVTLKESETINTLYQIVSPNKEDAGVWIHQDAWFHVGTFNERKEMAYMLKNASNGVYIFLLEGKCLVGGERLEKRDALAIEQAAKIELTLEKGSKLLVIEVPMSN